MKKGFTLIELLAVIVILAIIAVIAVPIVLNIINDTKKSAVLRSADFYIGALQNEIMLENMNQSSSFNPSTCEITNSVITCDGKEINLEVDGEVPNRGSITIEEGKVIDVELTYTSGTVTLNNKGELVLGDILPPKPKSFAEDSWETIIANVKLGKINVYRKNLEENTNNMKQITLTSLDTDIAGTYTVRIANTTTPEECSTEGFSQTACGFVVEFVDIISNHVMNLTNTTAGGWEKSEIRNYVNNDILNSFPEEIKTNIIDTYVVSGHESDKTKNYKTTDKLYLLSTKEVWGKEGTSSSNKVYYDTAELETRQLDYYKVIGVTTDNYSGAIKKYRGTATWWLRTAYHSDYVFYTVFSTGTQGNSSASSKNGVSIAFRIG